MDMECQLYNWQAKIPHDNLPPKERTAFKNLQQRNYIIIKSAHKGFAVVVLTKQDNINKANRQLNDVTYY